MTLPALKELPVAGTDHGTDRAARLMRLLGPAAASVWNELSAGETARLRQAMTTEPPQPERADAARFIAAFQSREEQAENPSATVWDRLSAANPDAIAATLGGEHPQVIALILSQLRSPVAAQSVRAMPRDAAIGALRHLLHTRRPDSRALAVIEHALQKRLDEGLAEAGRDGHQAVARIIDRLDSGLEKGFLISIEESDPGAAERIRSLMFTFDDLARLDPAAIQTILSRTDRSELACALKGAKPAISDVFLRNMTRRAGEMLKSEMEAIGPLRRSQVEAARSAITDIARGLARKGDILAAEDDDELIE